MRSPQQLTRACAAATGVEDVVRSRARRLSARCGGSRSHTAEALKWRTAYALHARKRSAKRENQHGSSTVCLRTLKL